MSRNINSVTVTMNNAASSNIASGSRVRLLGVQYYIKDDTGSGNNAARALANRDIRMQDSSGNDIFRFATLTVGSGGYGVGQQPLSIMFKDYSILFPDGIHFVNITTSGTQNPAPADIQVTVFYEAA